MAYKFNITLKDSLPPIFREVVVPESLTFHDFHLVIQIAMGWEDCHMYQFNLDTPYGDKEIALMDEDDYDQESRMDSEILTLKEVFGVKKKIYYIYDFGDDWIHVIKLGKKPKEEVLYPICTQGEGSCPLEDSGGIWRHYENIAILKSPDGSERKAELLEWLGLSETQNYEDINKFVIDEVNEALLLNFSVEQ